MTTSSLHRGQELVNDFPSQGASLGDCINVLRPRWKLLVVTLASTTGAAYGLTYLIPPTFTARTVLISPQQQQSSGAAAMASISALSGLIGANVKNQADQYVALLQSVSIADKLVERFKLREVYDVDSATDARRDLRDNTRVFAGKKDGLITVEVDDHDPKRASDMANAYIVELQELSARLAISEAKQRRVFFEEQLKGARDSLIAAQQRMEASGLTATAIKAEPRAAADAYAHTKAEVSSLEMRLAASRRQYTENSSVVQQQLAALQSAQSQLRAMEKPSPPGDQTSYLSAYREFKYQEALFEIFSRQFELAKLDEARDGTTFQVVDAATTPEKKSKPKRSIIAAIAGLLLTTALASRLLMTGLRQN
ncbi:MAG: lipopolysaccharide biosynthesis protein [Burkholderiales bacterium]|uniref:Wzz/FepE/Etk N-terminal domain-containing protein n=1 Tax=Roseateles sp. TaxID=1971397 RepID=UPI000FBFB450|nr:MAG: lipopolysaccharide biosynthesis protein [Burkholderiales bacterium]